MSVFANMPIKEWARQYAAEGGEPFHAVLCDAPYEIAFMNKGWDNSGVAFDVATWQDRKDLDAAESAIKELAPPKRWWQRRQ